MNNINKPHYNLVFLIFLILLLLIICILLILDNFFIHQLILELQNFNQEINDKFEYL